MDQNQALASSRLPRRYTFLKGYLLGLTAEARRLAAQADSPSAAYRLSGRIRQMFAARHLPVDFVFQNINNPNHLPFPQTLAEEAIRCAFRGGLQVGAVGLIEGETAFGPLYLVRSEGSFIINSKPFPPSVIGRKGLVIGVMGPGQATEPQLILAFKLGQMIANAGAVLLTGGMGGVMEAASHGAYEAGGLVVGICPTSNKADLNRYVHIPIVTGMGSRRNLINILTSDIVIAIGAVTPGTRNEVELAIENRKPLIIVGDDPSMRAEIRALAPSTVFVSTAEETANILPQFITR
jgi:uncharacterized protein (TIGR00725 family)